jgi:hypothetical protein
MNRLKETFYKLRYKLVYKIYQFLIKKLDIIDIYCRAQSVEYRECFSDNLGVFQAKFKAMIDYLESIERLENLNDKVETLLYESRTCYKKLDKHSIDILKFLIDRAESHDNN